MMSDLDDLEYFRNRAQAERQLSLDSHDAVTAAIHAKLADRYERLIGMEHGRRPILRIVSS